MNIVVILWISEKKAAENIDGGKRPKEQIADLKKAEG